MNLNINEAGIESSYGKGIVIHENVNINTNLGLSNSPLPSPQGQPALGTGQPALGTRSVDLMIVTFIESEDSKAKLTELARSAMLELNMKVHAGEPLWKHDAIKMTDVLDEGQYVKDFLLFDASVKDMLRLIEKEHNGSSFDRKSGEAVCTYRTEATRCSGYIKTNAGYLAYMLMDHNQWSEIFCGIISSPVQLVAIPMSSPGNRDEELHLVRADFQMANPQVNVRECTFLRYKTQISSGVWGVVELSLEKVLPYKQTIEFRRRASGCLIFETSNGLSKVVWVEHVETHDWDVHKHYKPFVFSGLAFGAHRYVAGLARHCHFLSTISLLKTTLMLNEQSEISQFGKGRLLKLSQRMVKIFLHNISLANDENNWVPMVAINDGNMMKMKINKIIKDNGSHHTVISFCASVFIPVHPHVVFEFLNDPESRPKWDVVSSVHEINERERIIPGGVPENIISIIETNSLIVKESRTYVQESFTDGTGLYVVFTSFDEHTLSMVFKGRDPDRMHMVPSGFVIHPDRPMCIDRDRRLCFSVVTIVLNIVGESSTRHHVPPKSVDFAREIMEETCRKIHAGVSSRTMDEDSDDEDDEDDCDD